MKNWREQWPLPMAILFYFLLWLKLDPWLGYMLDSDAVAYLTLAEKAAAGDFWRSVNGLWSPLNSWLLAPFIRYGYNSWETAKVFNALIGALLLLLAWLLSFRFIQHLKLRFCFIMSLALMMVYFVYFQVFADLLQLFFLLLYLLLLWSENFIHKSYKVILISLVMAMAFYAKAYTSLFFLLHFSVSLFWMYQTRKEFKPIYWRTWILGITLFLICLSPWSWAIHKKYQVWTVNGLAGKLNMSWYINSGKSFRDSIGLMIPPPYQNSPSFWEDPYLSQDHLSSPMSSMHHFFRWTARVVLTCFQAIACMNEISALALAILFFLLFYYFKREKNHLPIQLLGFTCLILPMGYLTMHIETRYLWLSAILLLIAGFFLIEQHIASRKIRLLGVLILCISFTYFPILQFESLRFKNKDLFEKANWMKSLGMKGSFTSNKTDSGAMWVIAYLTGNSFYTIEKSNYGLDELKKEMTRYHVDYYVQEIENNVSVNKLSGPEWELIASGFNLNVYRFKYGSLPNP